MAKTIEELNFQLKVDDKAFKAQMEADKKAAKDLADTVRDYLNIKKAQGTLSAKEYQTLKRLDNLESNRRINAEKELTAQAKRLAAEERLAQAKEKTNQHQERHNRLMREAASIATSYLSIWGAKKLLSELVQVTGEFEMQRTTLKAMLQDANGANAIYEQIKQLAVVSPFGFKELVTYTKQLAAYSVPIGELYDTTKMLADVSAGLGVGMDRLVLAYGQVRSAAFLRGQEVRQFTEAGIPILDMLAKQFEELEGRVVSTGDVFDKISRRQVPFEMVAKVFKDMTSEGGKFFNMQEIQADTLKGKISNLKDAYEILLNEIGQNLEPVMKGAVDTLRSLMENYEKVGRTIVELIAVYGTYRTALVLTQALNRGLGASLLLLETNFKKVGNAIAGVIFKNPYALIAAGATAAAYAMYKVIDAWTSSSRMMENYDRNTKKMESGIASETAALDALYAKLKVAKEGTKDYESAKRSIYTKYSEYIAALNEEGVAVDNLASLYENLKTKVQEAAREKFLRTALSDADEDFAKETDRIYKDFTQGFKSRMVKGYKDATAEQKEALWQYITGGMTREDVDKYVPDAWAGFVQWLRKDFKKAADEYKKIVAEIGEVAPAYDAEKAISSAPDMSNTEDAYKDEIDRLQKRIALLEKLRDVYESMRPYFSDTQIKDFFASSFGFADASLWENLDFSEQIDKLLSQLDELGTEGVEAANNVREKLAVALGKNVVDIQKLAIKAQESLSEYLKSWNIGDEIEGSGSTFKITKIVSDYQKALAALNDKRDEATEKLNRWIGAEKEAGRVVDGAIIKEKENTIATTYQTAATNLLNKATEDVRKTADDYLKEWSAINGIDLSNWSHKTIYELNNIQRTLDNFDASNLPQEIIDALNNAGIDIEKFKEAIKKVAGENSARAKTLANEKKWDYVLQAAEELAGLFEQIADYAEAAGNSTLKAFASGFASSFRTMSDIAEKVAKRDYIGAIVSGVTSVASAFFDAAKNAAELERNISKGKLAAGQLQTALALSKDTEGIFGEDKLKSISNAWDVASEKFKVAASEIAKAKKKLSGGTDNDSNGWGAAGGAAAGAALGAAVGVWFFGVGALIGAAVGAAVGAVTGGLVDIAKETDNFKKSLEEMASELKAPLYNEETGLFNVDTLQLILDTYDKLDEVSKEAIEAMITHLQDYEAALEQLRDGMKDVFGQVADDIASKFIEAFKQSGEAALDYADILDDVATSLAQMVLKSTLIERVFKDDLAGDIAQKIATGKMDEALALFDGAMTEAQELAPYFQEFLDSIGQYMQTNQTSDSLGNSIKGITEDQADLLASYVNGMRADVAYGKVQRDNILAEVKNIASYVASPTLMDYLNRIQANTFDTAQNTRDMLTEIRSMMTFVGEGSALRVYM